MRLRSSSVVPLVLLLSVIGCSRKEDPTGLIVEVTTQALVTPAELDAIELTVTNSENAILVAPRSYSLVGDAKVELPLRVAFRCDDDDCLALKVRVVGQREGVQVVSRTAQVLLEEHKLLLLSVPLAKACVNVVCGDAQTCIDDGQCQSDVISRGQLPAFTQDDDQPGNKPDAAIVDQPKEDAATPVSDAANPSVEPDGSSNMPPDADPGCSVCSALAHCDRSGGRERCVCNDGYAGNGVVCDDVDECATANGGCHAKAVCTNEVGGRRCTCSQGYEGNGVMCVVSDACGSNNGGCSVNATCTNKGGGNFECSCKAGYQGNGTVCEDINECLSNNGGCDANATCTNTAGSRTCACKGGYTGSGTTCSDINECTTNNGGCASAASCTNTPGSRTCACLSGYTGDGFTCADVNECATNNGGCNTNANCTNTPGSRTCACKAGYNGNGITCTANTLMWKAIEPDGRYITDYSCQPLGTAPPTGACTQKDQIITIGYATSNVGYQSRAVRSGASDQFCTGGNVAYTFTVGAPGIRECNTTGPLWNAGSGGFLCLANNGTPEGGEVWMGYTPGVGWSIGGCGSSYRCVARRFICSQE